MSPKNKKRVNFRHQKVRQQFIPGGGSLTDFGVSTEYWFRPHFGISAQVQGERGLFPAIQPDVAHNVTASVEVPLKPKNLFRPGPDKLSPSRKN